MQSIGKKRTGWASGPGAIMFMRYDGYCVRFSPLTRSCGSACPRPPRARRAPAAMMDEHEV